MQDLTLIGVHEDGQHLLLADAEGNRYRVGLDEALRAAARRDRPRLGQIQIEIEGGLRPKDVQAMIRSGLSAQEVAERAGWTVEKVHRYEGPILAEREHVAGLARQVRLRARGVGQSATPTLGDRVEERLRSRELDPAKVAWDSYRADRSSWVVVLRFVAGGREREASWDFDPLARTVFARDDEARWLSADEDTQSTGPIPAPHLSVPGSLSTSVPAPGAGPRPGSRTSTEHRATQRASASAPPTRPSAVYDVEADGGVGTPSERRSADTLDLMQAMRERSQQRGRRRRPRATDVPALDAAPDDALPLEELAHEPEGDPPAAHPRAGRLTGTAARRGTARVDPSDTRSETASEDDVADVLDGLTELGSRSVDNTRDLSDHGVDGDAGDTTPIPTTDQSAILVDDDESDHGVERTDDRAHDRARDAAVDDAAELEDPPADEPSAARPRGGQTPKPAARQSARKSGRPSVPSWDDIMFGRKSE